MKEIGMEGQQKLADAGVLVVGCGGLGAPVLHYLTAMGIGHLGICDYDVVSMSNLNRQILFTTADIGAPKVYVAENRLKALNPNLKLTTYHQNMDNQLAGSIIREYDLVVDCVDNFETRFILNDNCIAAGKPLIHAGVEEFCGQIMTIIPGQSPCLRCFLPADIKPAKKQVGIFGPTAGIIGSMQALEAAKLLLGMQTINDGIITFDGKNNKLEKVKFESNPQCSCKRR